MEFTHQGFEAIRKDIKQALSEVESKYDIEVTPSNITYDDYNGTFSLTLKAITSSGKKAKNAANERNPLFGKRFRDGRHTLTVVDFVSGKYSIICERDDGKQMRYTYQYVNDAESI